MTKPLSARSKPFPRRKRLRLLNFDYAQPGYAYFLTLCVKDSLPVFGNHELAARVVSILQEDRSRRGIRVFAYCLMPDHLHLVVSLDGRGKSIPAWLGDFKKLTTKAGWDCGLEGGLWQRSFYNHVVRRDENLESICRYVLENPVRAGMVTKTDEYPFSGTPDLIAR